MYDNPNLLIHLTLVVYQAVHHDSCMYLIRATRVSKCIDSQCRLNISVMAAIWKLETGINSIDKQAETCFTPSANYR